MLSAAVHSPPRWKSYLLCVLLGVSLCILLIGSVAAVRLCADARRRRSERALQAVRALLTDGGKGAADRAAADGDDPAGQPMLGGSTADSSRATTATHSRNTSTGSSNFVPTSAAAETLQLILDDPERGAARAGLIEEVA